MTTTVTKTVGSAGGRDYATLDAAITAIPADLVALDQKWVFNLFNDSVFNLSAGLVIACTCDATRNITIQCAPGNGLRDIATSASPLWWSQTLGVYLVRSGGSGAQFTLQANYVTFSGLQINATSAQAPTIHGVGYNNTVINDCLIASNTTGTTPCIYIDGKCTNTFVWNVDTGRCFIGLNSTEFRNCGAVGSGNEGFTGDFSDTPLYKNCEAWGFATAFGNATNAGNSNNVSDGTSPGTSSLSSKVYANQFVNITTQPYDFRVKAGADLIAAGVRDAANTADKDMINQTRSLTTPTVGPWEYGGGASPPPPPPGGSIVTVTGILPGAAGATGVRASVFTETGAGSPLLRKFSVGRTGDESTTALTFPAAVGGSVSISFSVPGGVSVPLGPVKVYFETDPESTGNNTELCDGTVT